MVYRRSIAKSILFSLITCGVYWFYWQYKINEAVTSLKPQRSLKQTSGLVVLLTIITCGIYGWYWIYTTSKDLSEISIEAQESRTDNSILNLILGIFGLSIVSLAIMQDQLNRIIDRRSMNGEGVVFPSEFPPYTQDQPYNTPNPPQD
jgi:hypothetical protein